MTKQIALDVLNTWLNTTKDQKLKMMITFIKNDLISDAIDVHRSMSRLTFCLERSNEAYLPVKIEL